MAQQLLRLAADDDVAIALEELPPNATAAAADGTSVTAVSGIPRGHKVALRDLAPGTLVHKYGHVIGVTTDAVRAGEHVHVHNLAMPEGERTRFRHREIRGDDDTPCRSAPFLPRHSPP